MTQDDDDFSEDEACWSCGGAGEHIDECICMDDTCCCLVPEPPICDECGGSGFTKTPKKEGPTRMSEDKIKIGIPANFRAARASCTPSCELAFHNGKLYQRHNLPDGRDAWLPVVTYDPDQLTGDKS